MQIAKEKLLCPCGGDHPLQDVEHFFVRLQGLHLIYGTCFKKMMPPSG